MYVGHAALAIALKSRARHVPMLPLALASYGPDWLEVALMIPRPREGMSPFTHSIPSVLIGAGVASLLYLALAKRSGAQWIFLAWLMHWPADFMTGHKPILGLDTLVGLDLYHVPMADWLLETAVVAACCAMYARVFAHSGVKRRIIVALATVLGVLQMGFDYALSQLDPGPWAPSLALALWRPHVTAPSAQLLHSHAALSQRASNGIERDEGNRDLDLSHLREGEVLQPRGARGGNL